MGLLQQLHVIALILETSYLLIIIGLVVGSVNSDVNATTEGSDKGGSCF